MRHGEGSNKGKRQRSCWCAASGGQYNWKDPNRVLIIQDSADPREAKVFRPHAPHGGPSENLVCAFKLLANLLKGADNLVETIFEGLQEQSRLKSRVTQGGSSKWTNMGR